MTIGALIGLRIARGLVPLACLLLPCAASAAPAPPDSSTAATATGRIVPAAESLSPDERRLRRAAAERLLGNPRGVVEQLESVDFSAGPPFAGADRAAFLLAQAYLDLGSTSRLLTLADQVAHWPDAGDYGRMLARLSDLIRLAAGDSTALSRLARSGDRLSASLAHALELGGADSASSGSTAWLSEVDSASALGQDLIGAAALRAATRRLARGEDPTALLSGVPPGSRYGARARRLLGLFQIERGDLAQGRATLEALAASDSSGEGRREVLRALASLALDAGDWEAAYRGFQAVDLDWSRNREGLKRMLPGDQDEALWNLWRSDPVARGALSLDAAPTREAAGRLADAATDFRGSAPFPLPALDAPPMPPAPRWHVAPPTRAEWSAIDASARALAESEYELTLARADSARESRRLESLRHYLGGGLAWTRREQALLQARAARLDSLQRTLDSLDARLKEVRDRAVRRVLTRAGAISNTVEGDLTWIGAMRHFHLEEPGRDRPLPVPPGFAGPDSLLREEETLARAVENGAQRLAALAPGLIARSYTEAWRPRIIDRAAFEAAEAASALSLARRLGRSIDSSLVAASGSATLRRFVALTDRLSRRTDSLRQSDGRLRARIARQAVERELAALETEREANDYGLAASSYALSVRLGRADSARATRPAADSTAVDAAEDPAARALRGEALGHLRNFLELHPGSAARGDARFRLADLEMVEARQEFHEQMAEFVRRTTASPGSLGSPPVLETGAALALYRKILAEDRDFPHPDAVLFNAGTLLADQGDPEGQQLFSRLVSEHPDSPDAQEAWLRMGDALFDDRRYAECIPLYQHAAAGSDTTLRVIALYRMGWAQFSEDHFLEAADAFRSILDLDAPGLKVANRVNLREEAEAYLVHSLARAGGAPAFARYFDGLGGRPYERRVLLALSSHFRRYSLFSEAVAADALLIDRDPLHPDALLGAERVLESYRRWERPALEKKAMLDYAPRFAPGSAWFQAQGSDSVRAAGAEFARACWTTVAVASHREARTTGSSASWREALDLYETVLAKWPGDSTAATLELRAGEAGAALGDYPRALAHYAAAARTGSDSIATQALWQRVAVTDAWYESTRGTGPGGAKTLGRDSLARAVLAAADVMLSRDPSSARAGDLIWREANLAFAHGWFERAADDLGRLATARPDDPRAPRAAGLRADALFKLGRFDAAGQAYEQTLALARKAGADTLAKRAERAIPVCYFRDAEAAVAADSTAYLSHAERFEKVAAGWPAYEHADLARYRAGLAFLSAGKPDEAVRSMRALISEHPKSDLARDAHLKIAAIHESRGERVEAARAYADFGARFPGDEQAGGASLKAADLFAAAGQLGQADTLRLAYLEAHPEDVETAMEILEGMARRELAAVDAKHPISALLRKPSKRGAAAPPPSRLADYLARAQAHPKLAAPDLIAQVRFLEAEEANAACSAARLRAPLAAAIAARQKLLNAAIARYRACVDLGVAEWSHASTLRIGEALGAFAEALEGSEKPADLKGDDLAAYEEVLARQAQAFRQKGEDVWAQMLRQQRDEKEPDRWVVAAQTALWSRLGDRFVFVPEAEYPLIKGTAPRIESNPDSGKSQDRSTGRGKGRPKKERASR